MILLTYISRFRIFFNPIYEYGLSPYAITPIALGGRRDFRAHYNSEMYLRIRTPGQDL